MPHKQLLLLRHAKSSWKDPQLEDHERPLNSRGRSAASVVGRLIRTEGLKPDSVLCSTALRTVETASIVFAEWNVSPEIVYRKDLYHAEPVQIASILSEIVKPRSQVMLIGHNPGLEQFLSQITGEESVMPTGALARVDLDLDDWGQFSISTSGTLMNLWRPRELDLE